MIQKAERKGFVTVDIPEYTALYNEWKNLHLQNKICFTNPAKYPDQIRKADELKQKNVMVSERNLPGNTSWKGK